MVISLTGVFVDGSAVSVSPSVQDIAFQQGEDVTINLTVLNSDGTAHSLATTAVILSVRSYPTNNIVAISRQGTITNNTAAFTLVKDDTKALPPSVYRYDIVVLANTGEYQHVVPESRLNLTPSVYHDGQPVTVPPALPPIFGGNVIVENNGVALPSHGTLNLLPRLIGADDNPNDRTNIDLAQTAVTPGSYTASNITVDAYGRITAASSGTSGAIIENAGTPLTQRPAINFQDPLIASDDVGNNRTNITMRALSFDEIAPAYAITSLTSPTLTLEVGQTLVNPSFTASYNRPAAFASFNDGSGAVTLVLPATSFAYGTAPLPATNYTKTAINATQVWTLTAYENALYPKTRTVTAIWEPRVYWGVSTDPGSYNAAFITGLASSQLQASRVKSGTVFTTGASQFMWFGIPTTFGGSSSNFIDASTGFAAGFSKVASAVATTNAYGVVINMDLWRSDVANLGTQTINVT